MSKIFSWEYFSFLTLDDGVVYKVEILLREGVGEGVGGGVGEDGVECVGGEGCESGNSDGGGSAL